MNVLRRYAVRALALVIFALFALGVVPEGWEGLNAILPRLSPLLNLFGALGAREFTGWMLLLGVPLLVLTLFKGRLFCWRICPMGFLAELAGKLNPWGKGWLRHVPYLNKVLALMIVVTAACGYPLLIWLDPLCIFNGFFAAWRAPLAWSTAVTGLGFVIVLLLAIAVPNVWCHRLCPLGGLQEAMLPLTRRLYTKKKAVDTSSAPAVLAPAVARRTVLAAVPMAVAGLASRKVLGPNGRNAVRPPSADPVRINALCARCGNCMKACPYGLLQPDLGATGIDGLFTPVLRLRSQDPDQEQFCFQDCVACTQVCPTGALHPLTVEEKHASPIGLAVVDKKTCVAWANGEYCVVCDEYCPYKAVKLVQKGGVNCPEIDPDLCRGCGACESACPAEKPAIVVKPL